MGLDFDCQIIDKNCPTGIHFKVQCKGRAETIKDKNFIKVPIKTKTVNYWHLEDCLVFIIVVDDAEKKFYWLDAKNFISKLGRGWGEKKIVTFSVPISNDFDITLRKFPQSIESIVLQEELVRKRGFKYKDVSRSEKRIIKELKILEDKLWFDRHQMIKDLVAAGKTEVNSDIWAGALKEEKQLIIKYGEKNLGPWSDFDWGMINGKISALRWLFGDDWDMLDS